MLKETSTSTDVKLLETMSKFQICLGNTKAHFKVQKI